MHIPKIVLTSRLLKCDHVAELFYVHPIMQWHTDLTDLCRHKDDPVLKSNHVALLMNIMMHNVQSYLEISTLCQIDN